MIILYGGNGFLGAHLAETLLDAGHDVLVTGRRTKPDARIDARATYAPVDDETLPSLISRASTIVYLAQSSRPSHDMLGVNHGVSENVSTSLEFLKTMADNAFQGQIFYLSSGGQVYGKQPSAPFHESQIAEPSTSYGLEKLLCENMFQYWARKYQANICVLRLGNPVGKFQMGTGHGFLSAAISAALEGTPLNLYGSGSNARDYFLATEFSAMIARLHRENWRGGGLFNIGSGIASTEMDIIQAVEKVSEKKINLIRKDGRPFDIPYAVLNTEKARKTLGWDCTVGVENIATVMIRNIEASVAEVLPVDD